jgi:hypothetical protein
LLVSWCVGGRCGMAGSDEDCDRSRRPDAEDRDGRTGRVLDGWAIGRSGDVVCGLHRARGDEEHKFLPVWTQNHSDGFSWFGLKTCGSGFPVWASKPSRLRFVDCTTKPMEGGWRGTRVAIWRLASLLKKW